MVNKRNNTDPDKKSIEGALVANRCRRAKTDPCKYRRYKDAIVETENKSVRSVAIQTEPPTPERRVSTQLVTKERSYSDPADVDALYDKTRCDSANSQSSTECDENPPPLPPRLTRIRKKSLSSPDIRNAHLSMPRNQPPIPHRRRRSSAYLNPPLETSCDTQDFILEYEPPHVAVRPPRPMSLIANSMTSPTRSPSEGTSSNPSTPKLIKRKMVYLRSYSNPPTKEITSQDKRETGDSQNNEGSRTRRQGDVEPHKPAPWLYSPSEPEAGDDLINGAARHFISEKAIYF